MEQQTTFTIRAALPADAPSIHAIHKLSLTTLSATHYPLDTLERWMARKTVEGYYPAIENGEMLVCESGQTMTGFGHAVPGEVVAIFVHPDYARQGVGSMLLRHAIAMATVGHTGPITLVATLNAVPFYKKHGFDEVRRHVIERDDIQFPVVDMVLPNHPTPP